MKGPVLLALLVLVSGSFALPEFFHEAPKGNLWAVLVAGSDSWDNYRHQADVCHAYQVLHNHGIPDNRIIVLMKDDLAQNENNPTPGIVVNHPQGKDVYKGVPHDYTGEAVTPENFMAVLRGDKQALRGVGSGKVLKSGPNDHVFVYFADHGAPGLIAFPESELSATDLNKTIHYMHANNRYKKMVIYIEACESGSMFKNILPKDINVYATTAANAVESSYACYFDDKRDTFLGDVYSVNWLEDSDKEDLAKETLNKQYHIVKKETNTSHVREFGDLSIGKMHVSEFQGRKSAQPIVHPKVKRNNVRSRDVPVEILKRKYFKATSDDEKVLLLKKIAKMLRNRQFLVQKVTDIIAEVFTDEEKRLHIFENHSEITNFPCYEEVRQYFNDECFELSKNHFALDYMHVLVNMCEENVPTRKMKQVMERICEHPPIHGIV